MSPISWGWMLSFPSWPGLSRPSTSFSRRDSQDVDARDKPGHDELDVKAPTLLFDFLALSGRRLRRALQKQRRNFAGAAAYAHHPRSRLAAGPHFGDIDAGRGEPLPG